MRHVLVRFGLFVAAVLLVAILPVAAQEPETAPEPPTESEAPEVEPGTEEAPAEEDLGQIDEIFEGEEEVLAGEGYSYDPGMRRDPFLSLLRRTRIDELGDRPRPEGVPGLLIDEVDLKGIFQMGGRRFAQVQTADKEKSFLIEAGDELFDGEVVSIGDNEVVFKQIVNDPSIIKPFREVVKKLNPEP